MSDWKQRARELAAHMLEVPQDATMDVPRVILIGGSHLLVENHRAIVEFSGTKVRLSLTKGELVVEGDQLVVKTILPDEISIEGKIALVRYIDESR